MSQRDVITAQRDPATRDTSRSKRRGPQISIGSWHMPLPRSKWLRVLIGCLLVVFGLLGFLPILGFWMVPLGLVVLSHDSAYIRRRRRRMAVWWGRRKQAKAMKRSEG
jgi:purine-cytosine permease-like protein